MKIINELDLSLESMLEVFEEKDISANVVEVSPADESLGLRRDAFLELTSDSRKVIIWTNCNGDPDPTLRMRVVLLNQKHRKNIGQDKLTSLIGNMNQNAQCFGTVDGENGLGVTLEYKLPFKQGILDETIYSAYEELLKGAQVWECFAEDLLDG